MRRLFVPLFIGVLGAGLLVWAFAPRAIVVETAAILRRDLAVTVEAEGVARIREVAVISAPIFGTMQRVTLHAGDAVAKGETVARIGPAAPALLDVRAQAIAEAGAAAAAAAVELAQAQLDQADAARSFARTELDRARALFTRGALSQRLLDDADLADKAAQAALVSAGANLTVRKQELESARAQLARGTAGADSGCCVDVVAPVSGKILNVVQEDEQVVQAGTPLLEIGDPADLEIEADVLSRDAVALREGAAAIITGWGGEDLGGRVLRVGPAAVMRVSALGIEEQRVKVVLVLDAAPPPALGHGFRVLARVTVWQGTDVLCVPIGALFRDGATWAVFAVTHGRATKIPIEINHRNQDFAEVTAGLEAGTMVILHPADSISEGTRVSPAPAAP